MLCRLSVTGGKEPIRGKVLPLPPVACPGFGAAQQAGLTVVPCNRVHLPRTARRWPGRDASATAEGHYSFLPCWSPFLHQGNRAQEEGMCKSAPSRLWQTVPLGSGETQGLASPAVPSSQSLGQERTGQEESVPILTGLRCWVLRETMRDPGPTQKAVCTVFPD